MRLRRTLLLLFGAHACDMVPRAELLNAIRSAHAGGGQDTIIRLIITENGDGPTVG